MDSTDWQQITALTVVALVALLFLRSALMKHGKKPGCGGSCGCSESKNRPAPPSVTFRAKKGGRPEITFKENR